MSNEHEDKFEQRLRFVAKHYREEGLDSNKAWKRFACTHAVEVRRFRLPHYLLAIASVALVLVAISTGIIYYQSTPQWVVVTTEQGQVKNVYLPDSTLVSMAGNSRIQYDVRSFGKDRRAVEMKGKAFFEVTRDEARPFSVQTNATKVTVLGTSFQLDEQPGSTEVYVATGKVCFSAGQENEPLLLTAGMSASYSMEKNKITLVTEEEANNLSWKTRQLRFFNTPLNKVIEDLNNHYQVRIISKSPDAEGKLTATFNDLPLEEVLLVISQTLDIRLVAAPTDNLSDNNSVTH